MKRITAIIALLLVCAMSISANTIAEAANDFNHIVDNVGLFTSEDLALYEKTAKELSDKYRCGVYYVSVDDYTKIAEGGAGDAAQYIYEKYDLGYGEERDGLIMLVSVAEGDYGLFKQGFIVDVLDGKPLLKDAVGDSWKGDKGVIEKFFSDLQAYLSLSAINAESYVTDTYGLLTTDEEATLEAKAAELSLKYGCGVYIIIVDDYSKYGRGNAFDAASDVFEACKLGEGPNNAGILLMMSMKWRDITIITNESGLAMVSADAKDWLEVKYLKHFKNNEWFDGYDAFLTNLETVLKMSAEGSPMTWLTFPETRAFGILVAILGGLGISYLVMKRIRDKMKSVFAAATADAYITQGGVSITKSIDEFSHKTTVRHRVSSSSSSGRSGGGSRSSNSRGFSGKSSKF